MNNTKTSTARPYLHVMPRYAPGQRGQVFQLSDESPRIALAESVASTSRPTSSPRETSNRCASPARPGSKWSRPRRTQDSTRPGAARLTRPRHRRSAACTGTLTVRTSPGIGGRLQQRTARPLSWVRRGRLLLGAEARWVVSSADAHPPQTDRPGSSRIGTRRRDENVNRPSRHPGAARHHRSAEPVRHRPRRLRGRGREPKEPAMTTWRRLWHSA